ncbi:MAG: EFR1 family ferrodoxin [Coprobacillus sp.]
MLFYFTGTGNSLYVARQFEQEPISIAQVMKQDAMEFEDETIGVVWPIYAGEPPHMILEFLKKASFKTDYFYMILTYGKDATDAPECIYAKAQEFGVHIDYIHTIYMVDNYLPSFDMNEQKAMTKTTEEDIQQALNDIKNRKKGIPEADQAAKDFHAKAAQIFAEKPFLINGEQITVTEKCIGCGICAKVCPVGNFSIEDKKAKRKSETCEFCLACAHNCPQMAITTSVSDKNPTARFRNEHVTLQDIIKSNQQ